MLGGTQEKEILAVSEFKSILKSSIVGSFSSLILFVRLPIALIVEGPSVCARLPAFSLTRIDEQVVEITRFSSRTEQTCDRADMA